MNARKILRYTAFAVGGAIALLVVVLALVLWLGLTVNLNALRAPIAEAATETLGRQFRIDGDVSVEASLWPTLKVHAVRVANADGFTEAEFASLDKLWLQVGVLPLLGGKIHVRKLIADGVHVNLESNADGENNWQFGTAGQVEAAEEPGPTPEAGEAQREPPKVAFEVDELSLGNISANYVDRALDKSFKFNLAKFKGSAGMETPLELDIEGGVQEQAFSLAISGPSLEELSNPAKVSPVEILGDVAGTPVDIAANYSHENGEPRLEFGLELGATDVGAVIAWLGVAEGLDLSTEKFSVAVVLRGNSLDKLARTSEFSAELTGGQWNIKDADGEVEKSMRLERGAIEAGPEQPLTIALTGTMDRTPIDIHTTGTLLIDYIKRDRALPIKFVVDFADVSLALTGNLTVPIKQGPFDMDLSLSGDNLTTFNESLGLDLPPLGPYRVEGRYATSDRGYALTNLVLAVGESELNGDFDLDATQTPPRLEVRLTTPRLQLNDFNFEGWSAEGGDTRDEEMDTEPAEKEAPQEGGTAPVETHSLLSMQALNSLNARFELSVEEVLSGKDVIGQGQLTIVLEDGRLTVQPLHLTIPGGSVDVEFGYRPLTDDVELSLKTVVDRFDYGILARRVNPDTEMGGKVFLRVALIARANNIQGLMKGGRGHFDFALLPEQFDAGIFDLWAVNLLSALSKQVDDEPDSVVNCVLARFTLDDGLMQDRIIFMDTTRMSVFGKAKVDFNQESLDVYAKPSAKRPEFFSIAVPVGVSGRFDDWGIDIGIVPVAWAGVSFVTSPVHVPIRRLFGGEKPLEGEEACREAWRKSEEPPEEPKKFESKAFR